MNFDDAIKAHSEWKMKLGAYIRRPDQSLNPDDVEPDNKCVLGTWIHGEGMSYKDLDEYKTLKDCHAKFHHCAAGIIRQADQGEDLSMDVSLGGSSDYAKLSSEIVGLIMAMRRKVEGK